MSWLHRWAGSCNARSIRPVRIGAAVLLAVAGGVLSAGPMRVLPVGTAVVYAHDSFPPSSIARGGGLCNDPLTDVDCYVDARPDLTFSAMGTVRTTVFTCSYAVASDLTGGLTPASAQVVPGCYNVSASVKDETTGLDSTYTYARCGHYPVAVSGSTANCAAYASPLCPGQFQTTPASATYCSTYDWEAPEGGQMEIQINPGTPHFYTITFTGYTPPTADGSCPRGMQYIKGPYNLPENLFVSPFETQITVSPAACRFTLVSEVYIVQIGITLAANPSPPAKLCGGTAVFSTQFHGYIGAACRLTPRVTSVVVLKIGVDCSQEPPANGTPASSASTVDNFPPGSIYVCANRTLMVQYISLVFLASGFLETVVKVSGPGSFVRVHSPLADKLLASQDWCSGLPHGSIYVSWPGTEMMLCPTGLGSGSVQACLATSVDSQPYMCSNVQRFLYH